MNTLLVLFIYLSLFGLETILLNIIDCDNAY